MLAFNKQVAKYNLDMSELKAKYKQIAGFHFVSSVTRSGISNLEKDLVEVTLQQKYIGEKIPVIFKCLIQGCDFFNRKLKFNIKQMSYLFYK